MTLKNRFPKYLAELIATFCLVFFGTGAIVVNSYVANLSHLGVSLVFGLIVLAMVYAVGHISGAHMNPAVTIGFFMGKRLPGSEVPWYVLAQLLGACLASLNLKILFSSFGSNLGATQLAEISVLSGLSLEIIMTFVLMFVIMGVATDHRAQGVMAGVAIGAVITLEAVFAGPLTGASMNPARSFGPAVFSGIWSHHWIYWLGPIIGSSLGAICYKAIQCHTPSGSSESGCC